ncbi:MAG: hypothetical protein H7067_07800 [Burkholderiales bacterium]|nr:hypothetical protein [Opitutaceae bacterium]
MTRFKIAPDDLCQPRHRADAPNPGLRRVRIVVLTAAQQSGCLGIHAELGASTRAQ